LRPEADGPGLTGVLEQRLPNGRLVHEFHFLVVRAWEKPVDEVLQGGVATLPLAPLADLTAEQLPGVIARMRQRLDHEVSPEESATLWTATYILMGLRYPADLTARVLQGVRNMRESATYQAILAEGEARGEVKGRAEGKAEGKAEEAASILLLLGRERFGDPSPETVATIEAIANVSRIELLAKRLLVVSSWDELISGDEPDHPQ
jgi:predicted transposase YdaD